MSENRISLWGLRSVQAAIDRTTTYRLMLYYLSALFVTAVALAVFNIIPYTASALFWSLAVLAAAGWLVNGLSARILGAVTNLESVYITALILVFVLPPVAFGDTAGALLLMTVAAAAMASKYVLAWRRKHIFNPAALAIAFSASLGLPAAWWVAGTPALLLLVVLGGLTMAYKLRRFDVLAAFGAAALLAAVLISPAPLAGIQATLQYSPIFFFAFVMLTEPSTMPPTRAVRLAFGAVVGALFIVAPAIGPLLFSPEMSLLAGNLFAFAAGTRGRYALTFLERRPLAKGIYEYRFTSDRPIPFSPGQYLEWTLPRVPYDERGNRRYFTIASAPGDEHVALGVRFYEKPSAFKRTLAALPAGAVLSVVSPAGDFTLPSDAKQKCAFLAGGIGVTPVVSMARHCLLRGEKRDAVLLYSAKTEDEVAYQDVFSGATQNGFRTSYIISKNIDADCIAREIPDYRERLFYLSGPPGFVGAMQRHLRTLGVSRFSIKIDFFPGLAA